MRNMVLFLSIFAFPAACVATNQGWKCPVLKDAHDQQTGVTNCRQVVESLGPQLLLLVNNGADEVWLADSVVTGCHTNPLAFKVPYKQDSEGFDTSVVLDINGHLNICNKTFSQVSVSQTGACLVKLTGSNPLKLEFSNLSEDPIFYQYHHGYEEQKGYIGAYAQHSATIMLLTGVSRIHGHCAKQSFDYRPMSSEKKICEVRVVEAGIPTIPAKLLCVNLAYSKACIIIVLSLLVIMMVERTPLKLLLIPIMVLINLPGMIVTDLLPRRFKCYICGKLKTCRHACQLTCTRSSKQIFNPQTFIDHIQDRIVTMNTIKGPIEHKISGCIACRSNGLSKRWRISYSSKSMRSIVTLVVTALTFSWLIQGVIPARVIGEWNGNTVYAHSCNKISYSHKKSVCGRHRRTMDPTFETQVADDLDKYSKNCSLAETGMSVLMAAIKNNGTCDFDVLSQLSGAVKGADRLKYAHRVLPSLRSTQSGIAKITNAYSSDGMWRFDATLQMTATPGSSHSWVVKDGNRKTKLKTLVTAVASRCSYEYLYTTCRTVSFSSNYTDHCTGDCSQCNQTGVVVRGDFDRSSNWLCEKTWCLAVQDGCLCGSCKNEFDMNSCHNVYSLVKCQNQVEVCMTHVNDGWCKTITDGYSSDEVLQTKLQDTNHGEPKIVAVDKKNRLKYGNINLLGEHDDRFGTPQLTVDGRLLRYQENFHGRFTCKSVGSKSVQVDRCMKDTYYKEKDLTTSEGATIVTEKTKNGLTVTSMVKSGLDIELIIAMDSIRIENDINIRANVTILPAGCSPCTVCAPMTMACKLVVMSDADVPMENNCEGQLLPSREITIKPGKAEHILIIPHRHSELNCTMSNQDNKWGYSIHLGEPPAVDSYQDGMGLIWSAKEVQDIYEPSKAWNEYFTSGFSVLNIMKYGSSVALVVLILYLVYQLITFLMTERALRLNKQHFY